MEKFLQLREQYKIFNYYGFDVDIIAEEISIVYHFEIEGLAKFNPSWKFAAKGHTLEELKNNKIFMELVFSLGMVELISYWKLACPTSVNVYAGQLTDKQCSWWKELYYYGLSEYFYTNGIDVSMDDFMNLESLGEKITGKYVPVSNNDRCLVPIGGGKDSAVSLELLRSAGKDINGYIINPRGATVNTAIAAKLPEDKLFTVKRTLDATMVELNKKGFLNGHTPYSAIVAFSSTITAYLNGINYIALSNEASANESTVKGSYVNHQYSKSFKFEKDFHDYEEEFIGSGTYYFSLLRPLSEFQIARYFAKCEAYHDIFRSCNVGSKEDIWCGHCPKCLFVFLILSPFIKHKRMVEIFGTDMVADESMIPVMEQLIGAVDEKPFECVGSRDEVNTACCMVIYDYLKKGEKLPALYEHYYNKGFYNENLVLNNQFFTLFDEENLLKEEFADLIKQNCCVL